MIKFFCSPKATFEFGQGKLTFGPQKKSLPELLSGSWWVEPPFFEKYAQVKLYNVPDRGENKKGVEIRRVPKQKAAKAKAKKEMIPKIKNNSRKI